MGQYCLKCRIMCIVWLTTKQKNIFAYDRLQQLTLSISLGEYLDQVLLFSLSLLEKPLFH